MDELTPEALVALAKKHLGITQHSEDASVPLSYLNELKLHLMLYPHDDNFTVTLEPKTGYGKITCFEKGCDNEVVTLMKRVGFGLHDGGKSEGLGSLASYRTHIQLHPTHAKNRLARVKSQRSADANTPSRAFTTPVKQEQAQRSSRMSLQAQPDLSADSSGVSSLVHVKPEMFEPSIPRKRVSDSALTMKDINLDTSPSSSTFKRLKTLDSKGLLEPINNSTNISELPSPVEDTPAKSSKTEIEISITQSALDRLLRKSKKSVLDMGKIKAYTRLLERLKKDKEQLKCTLPSVATTTTTTKPKFSTVTHTLEQETSTDEELTAVKSEVLPMDVDCKPSVEVQAFPKLERHTIPLGNGSVDAARQIMLVDSRGPPMEYVNPETVKTEAITHLKAPPMTYSLHDTKGEDSPPVLMTSCLTGEPGPSKQSCHKGPAFPSIPGYVDVSDDEDGMAPYLPTIAVDLVNRIGINVPPPLLDEAHDDNGDYYGRGRDRFAGHQARADDIDKFLIEAGNAEAFDGNATVDQALEVLGLKSQYDLLPGMEMALMPHQTIGVAWMLNKEKSKLQGGCLGDDMGLGKTIQMMALIIKNQSRDPKSKTNLIVAPTALLDQWKLEIEMKTNCDLKCLIYHGASKPRKKADLLQYDVVLTTYMTMSLEWPDFEAEEKKKEKAKRQKKKRNDFVVSDPDDDDDDDDDVPTRKEKRRKQAGLLFQVDFYRVILDEAQAIRNRRTRASRATTDLRSTYRWCLTGTPIINGLADVYGYMRFLKLRPWYDFKEFQSHIGLFEKKNPALAISRMQAIIATFQLRRMKDSMLDGKRLIELPAKEINLIKLEFSEEEREVYQMVEARSQAKFNRFLRAGTVLKNYHQVLVLLLRLRQVCSHPCLIQEGGGAYLAPDEVDDNIKPELATELTRARRLVSAEFVRMMQEKFKQAMQTRMQAEKESPDTAVEDEECPICFDNFTNAVITPCAHIFCNDCLVEVLNNPPTEGAQDEPAKYKLNERPCPSCRAPICLEKLFKREAFELSDEEVREKVTKVNGVARKSAKRTKKGKGRAPRTRAIDSDNMIDSEESEFVDDDDDDDDDDDLSDFIVQSDEDEEEKDARNMRKKRLGQRNLRVILDSDEEVEDTPEEKEVLFGAKKKLPMSEQEIKLMPRILPSTKMKYMMEQLKNLTKRKPEEKTLIVSQWTGCLALVSEYLTEAGIVHVKYQGDMNRAKRDQAVRVFMSKDKARIMLMSLKCGGVGLNLTRANNVISLDLGWSRAIEAQAFDRVHRLGQLRPVNVQRLVIADTVEDRVLAMQERKQNIADGSLGEGNGKKIGKLTVRELANLFGLDHRGRLLAKD